MSLLEKALEKYAHHESEVSDQELREVLDDDWDEVSNDPAQFEAARYSLRTIQQIAAGQVPDSYSAKTICKHCGPVPIWEGCDPEVAGCPWCFNRIKGLPIPKEGNDESFTI